MSDDDNIPKTQTAFWDQSLARMTAMLTIVSMIFGAGLWVGQVIADAKGQAEKSELNAKLARVEADMTIHSAKVDSQAEQLNAMNAERARLQSAGDAQQQQIAELSQQLGLQSNCTFIHQQIKATEADIERPSMDSIMAAGIQFDQSQAERRTLLRERLAAYQAQLGTCNR